MRALVNPPESDTDRSLRLEDIIVRRGRVEILRGINLTFDPAHRHVILGASGSGKSTLIRLLNRLDDPDSGSITLGGVPLPALPVLDLRRRIGLVFQTPRPLPGTLGDYLRYAHQVRNQAGPDRSEQAEALRDVGLDPNWLDRDTGELSGGERQRLALAAALGMKPEILVLDEPTAALDLASARLIADLLQREARTRRLRTIVVTHDRTMAPRLGDRGIRLAGGRVVDQGPILDVLAGEDAPG